jgi:transmembrane sensor
VAVHYAAGERRIRLDRGEALFEVAKNPARPFIVVAGDEQVRALGTVFMVRRGAAAVAVTLLEGKVSVTTPERSDHRPSTVLAPGQRLTVRAEVGAALDRPKLDAVTAWRRGQAVFDNTALIDAAAELNRYGGRTLVIGDPSLSGLKVSGGFATSDTAEFAAAVAALYDLSIEQDGDRIVLVKNTAG